MKLLVVVLALALLVWLLFGRSGKRRRTRDPSARPTPPLEGMVSCAHCGVHLPASEALLAHGRSYCSAAHRNAGPPAP